MTPGARFVQCYVDVFDGGRHDLAPDYFVEDYREHNPHIEDGIAASVEHQQRLGGYRCRVVSWCEDGDLVFVRAHYLLRGRGFDVVDVYRLDTTGRATEHWDTVVPADLPGDWEERAVLPPPLAGPAEVERARVLELYDGPLRRRDATALAEFVHSSYASVPGAGSRFAPMPDRRDYDWSVDEVRHVGIQGDLAIVFWRATTANHGWWVADILRYANGLIADAQCVAGHRHDR